MNPFIGTAIVTALIADDTTTLQKIFSDIPGDRSAKLAAFASAIYGEMLHAYLEDHPELSEIHEGQLLAGDVESWLRQQE